MKTQKRGEWARSRIFGIINDRWQRGANAPTIRDIAAETGYGLATVHRHVAILVAQGRLKGRGRTLQPVDPGGTPPD